MTTSDSQVLVLPAYAEIIDLPLPAVAMSIIEQNFNLFLAKSQQQHQQQLDKYKRYQVDCSSFVSDYTKIQGITADDLQNMFDYLNGQAALNETLNQLKSILPDGSSLLTNVILKDDRLLALPEFNLFHLFRSFQLHKEPMRCFEYSFYDYDIARNADLRQVVQVLKNIDGYSIEYAIEYAFLGGVSAHLWMDKELVWPFFAENRHYLDDALGFPNKDKNLLTLDARNAIKILSYFPRLPNEYVSFLFAIALASTKALRSEAQYLLMTQKDIHQYAEKALWSTNAEERIVAAKWLAKIGKPSSINVLYQVLKQEQKEDVKAAILATLQHFGEHIDDYLSHDALLKQAQKGLQTKIPVAINWLKKEMLPTLTWQDGSPIDPCVIYWWIVFSVKLKDPKTHPILQCYINLLSTDSQQKLGVFILKSFITYDTRTFSLDQATAQAQQELQNRLLMDQRAQANPELYPQYQHVVEQDFVDKLTKFYLSCCVDDLAINCRGMLALIIGINGYQAKCLLQEYIKKYPSRHKQFRYMLDAISMTNHPLLLQFLNAIARSYQISSVKKCAKALLNEIVERNNWNDWQVSERILSNLNWNEHEQLILDYGSRQFLATLNDRCELELHNSDGKAIKALPAITANDSESLAKQAKTILAESKKTLKSVVETQTAHLYEAMCLQHQWTLSDWQTALLEHTIMNKLAQRLIWIEINPEQQIINAFRLVNTDQFVDYNGNDVTLKPNSQIMLAHSAILDSSIVDAWLEYLEKHPISPLFDQFPKVVIPSSAYQQQSIQLDQNLMIDSGMMIKLLHQLNYQASSWSIYSEQKIYSKTFKHSDVAINIEFINDHSDEKSEQFISASLNFSHERPFHRKIVSITHVSPIIVLEGYRDYQQIIKLCTK
ncbi:DUF4132 domain-containing protein [Orbus mooreae]|uniref:DUF4132 domain-containing protein n=1 Tax=Orbus mooreae TaxID=3074107 RepID=UPI00370D64D8